MNCFVWKAKLALTYRAFVDASVPFSSCPDTNSASLPPVRCSFSPLPPAANSAERLSSPSMAFNNSSLASAFGTTAHTPAFFASISSSVE